MFIPRDSVSPIEFGGLRIFDYTAGRESSSSLALVHVPPGASHPEALSRRSDKYYLVVSGTVRFVVEGDARDLGNGDACIVGCGQRFRYANSTAEDATLVLVHTPRFELEAEVFLE